MILRTHKVRLYPTKEQEVLLSKSVGVARFAYNWALNRWNELYSDGNNPNARDIRNEFVQLKKNEEYSWLKEVSKETYSNAILNMGTAWSNFFRTKRGKPKFKSKKNNKDSYTEISNGRINNSNLRWEGKYLHIPKFIKDNMLRTAELPRFDGYIRQVTISRKAGIWFASVLFKLNKPPSNQYKCHRHKIDKVGIDLGVKTLATFSDGNFIEKLNVNDIADKIKLQQRRLSRKVYNSQNYLKAKTKLQRLYMRKENMIKDHLHKGTNFIVRHYNKICIEDLRSSNLMKNHKLAKEIANAQFYEFRRQLEYKIQYLKERNVTVDLFLADKFYPSSKTCSHCGNIKDKLSLSERIYHCDKCGYEIDRDLNAAINLEHLLD